MNDVVLRPLLQSSDELALVAKIKAGDKELFRELVQPYLRSLRAVCRSMLANSTDIDEVMQETLLKAFVGLDQLQNESSFRAWLFQIARNESLTCNRRAQKYLHDSSLPDDQPQQPGEESPLMAIADERELPSEIIERQEMRAAIELAVNSLAKKDREVFLLHDVQGLTVTDMSRLLDISVAAATSRLHRARLHLRSYLLRFVAAVGPAPCKSCGNSQTGARRFSGSVQGVSRSRAAKTGK